MKSSCEIEGLTIAVQQMDLMLAFYSALFAIDFVPQKLLNHTLYQGQWSSLKLLLCPASLANNTATQNRQQFDVVVVDLDDLMQKKLEYGGSIIGEFQQADDCKSVGVKDPDGNTLVLKEYLKA